VALVEKLAESVEEKVLAFGGGEAADAEDFDDAVA
jgi:hypothetical protein